MKRLPRMMEMMESMIETNDQFEGYQTEIKAISKLGISFEDWTKFDQGRVKVASLPSAATRLL